LYRPYRAPTCNFFLAAGEVPLTFPAVFQPGQDVPLVIGGVEVGRIPVDDLLP
jgi:hypothetical protein